MISFPSRRNFSILLFRIYHRGDVFDISNPPSPGFPLVSALVAYYQQQRPFTSIDAPIPRLLYPVVRNNILELPLNLVSVSSDLIVKGLLTALRSTSVELNQMQVKVSHYRPPLYPCGFYEIPGLYMPILLC